MTVFDRIQTMTKDELQKLVYAIYLWGHINERCNLDDMYFYQTLLDAPSSTADDIVSSLADLEPYKVRVIPLCGNDEPMQRALCDRSAKVMWSVPSEKAILSGTRSTVRSKYSRILVCIQNSS